MTKSLANKICLKEHLCTFSMANGTPIQNYLDKFNSLIIYLVIIDVKLEDEDKTILLVISLPSSYKHFKEIMLYSNNETLSFDDVKATFFQKKNLIFKCFLMTKLKACQWEGEHLKRRAKIGEIPDQSPGDVIPTGSVNTAEGHDM